ncbi:hypothetical protein MMC12_008037 [Toensbergia leucococca]|nr:hypothetical protein [Toensbergia leucococca]
MAYSTVLKALLQLRTLCNNGTYTRTGGIDATQGIVEKSRETLERLWQEDQASCVNCSRTVSSLNLSGDHGSGYLTACPHLICAVCMPLYRIEAENEQEPRVQCLSCIEDVLQQFSGLEPEYIANSPDFGLEQENSVFPSMVDEHSSKMSALVAELQQNMNGSKSIVFSSWIRSLDIASSLLYDRGIKFVRVDGSRSMPNRRKLFLQFKEDPDTCILLMTFGTGAVGLNLTIASRIHILEPQWNPSVEAQAIGRVLRLGQQENVAVTRYIVRNTVEEFIRCRQSRKLHLAKIGWQRDKEGQEEDPKLRRLMVRRGDYLIEARSGMNRTNERLHRIYAP